VAGPLPVRTGPAGTLSTAVIVTFGTDIDFNASHDPCWVAAANKKIGRMGPAPTRASRLSGRFGRVAAFASETAPLRKACEPSKALSRDDSRAGNCGSIRDQRQPPVTIGSCSRMQHALNSRIHLVFFDRVASRDLIHSNLHLLLKPIIPGEQFRYGLLHQVAHCPAGLGSEGSKPGFFVRRQKYFHTQKVSP
jgi:hypothetical protein